MKIYLVGGAVRDKILGFPHQEKDWVVVGATVDDMLKQGFRQVGKDFPVFIHPKTGEEYALARTERKTGRGYTGFIFDASTHVTLEDDLKRRDLTINAIAETPEGQFIDPYHGKEDIEKKILRHVSPAFAEDPVRILRVARFAARYAHLGFTIASETIALMQQMVASGEINALVPERVWKEFERALSEKNPEKFFEVLTKCHALPILFPTIKLTKPLTISPDTQIRFAILLHNQSEADIKALCDHYRVPSDYRELALLVARHLTAYEKISQLNAEEILNLLQNVDAFRREERFKKFLTACEISSEKSPEKLLVCFLAAKSVDISNLINSDLKGHEIAERIKEKRKAAIEASLSCT